MGYKATIMRTVDGHTAVNRNLVVSRGGKHFVGIPVEDDNGTARLAESEIEVEEAEVIVHKTISLGDKVLAAEWNFDLTFAECEEAEKLFGKPFSKFEDLVDQSIVARKILVFILLKRDSENKNLRLSDLDSRSRSDYRIDVAYEDAPPEDEADPTAGAPSPPSEAVSPEPGPGSENEPA